MVIRPIDQEDREQVDAFIVGQWYTLQMVVRGESVDLSAAEGLYACEGDEITGLITWRVTDGEMEILSLDSVHERLGTGTALLDEAIAAARRAGVERIRLITTNDNLSAMRFYQKRGFHMARLYRNALDLARRIKPEIPLIGMDDIPLRDEIEFEREL